MKTGLKKGWVELSKLCDSPAQTRKYQRKAKQVEGVYSQFLGSKGRGVWIVHKEEFLKLF